MRELMYLDLPGFNQENSLQRTGKRLYGQSSHLETLLTSLPGKTIPKTYKQYRFKSNDIDDRVSWIEYEINIGKRDPQIRHIAAGVVRGIPPRQWERSADGLFHWTRDNIRYTLDPHNVELFQRANRSVDEGIGDCDDQSIVLASLLQSIGLPVRLRVIGLKGSDQFQHIYVLVGLPPTGPTKWKALDPSRPEAPGWELPANQRGRLVDYIVEDYDPEENE
jgi:transglutaminase-like putative cysteine protease